MWSAQEQFSGGQITAGDLNITGTQVGIWDVSPDRADIDPATGGVNVGSASTIIGHEIENLEDWRQVPGDTVMFQMDATPELRGDNLVAVLTIDGLAELRESEHEIPGTFEVSVARGGEYLLERTDVDQLTTTNGSIELGHWSPHASGIADTTEIDPDNPVIEVRVFATFDPETSERDAVNAVNTLTGLSVGLHQVRNLAPHFTN